MKSVILINYTGKKGGGAAYALEMAEALIKNDKRIIAILSSDIENKSKWDKLDAEKIVYIKTYTNYLTFIFRLILWFIQKRKIRRELKGYKVSSIYIPMEQPFTRKINKIFNKKILLTVHDVDPHSGDNKITALIGKFLNRGLREKADNVILLSNTFINRYSEKYNYDKNNISVLRHGLFFQYRANSSINDNNVIDTTENTVLFFGRISYYKGIDILIEAFKKIEDKYSVRLLIVGSGDLTPYNNLLKDLKSVKIVNEWIKDENIQEYFSNKNTILVVPYRDATQSGVISLANLFKVPVIASNTGGLVEQVSDMKTGLLFDNSDIQDLANKIMFAIDNKQILSILTDNAFKETNELWDLAAKRIIQLSDNDEDVVHNV